MSTPIAAVPHTPTLRLLEALIAEHGVERGEYALFFVTGEGDYLPMDVPDPVEEMSGYLLDRAGRVFAWWLAWDAEQGRPALTEWEQVGPEPDWREEAEYLDARRRLALPDA